MLHLTAEANGRKRHRLGFRDVVYFRLKGSLEAEGMQLNRADRRDVYAVLSAKKHSAGSLERKGLKLTRTGGGCLMSSTYRLGYKWGDYQMIEKIQNAQTLPTVALES